MKLIITITLLLISTVTSSAQWKLIYEHDAQGHVISGSKTDLIEAINAGADVKVGWKMGNGAQSVTHFAAGIFLTILNNEVFAQIDPILSQKPDFENTQITFREDLKWSFIASTTGENSTFFYLYETGKPIDSKIYKWGNKWFVKY